MLKLVSSVPDFFAHHGDSPVISGEGFGCQCAKCNRPVSAPYGYEKKLIWCLYCGMADGYVQMIECPWPKRYSFGTTREECLEDREALQRGVPAYEHMAEARARREERTLDLPLFD